jgi:hypothetical protein
LLVVAVMVLEIFCVDDKVVAIARIVIGQKYLAMLAVGVRHRFSRSTHVH